MDLKSNQLRPCHIKLLEFFCVNLNEFVKVEGHIPARISDVPSWDAETIFLYILSIPQSWCKSNYEKI